MKMQQLLSTVVVTSILATGALVTTQSVNAESNTETQTKAQVENDKPKVKKGYLVHYNVLRIELDQPIDPMIAYAALVYGDSINVGDESSVMENGKIIAFDINIDDFNKQFPTKEKKELFVNTLTLRYITYDGMYNENISITDNFVQSTLLNAGDQKPILGTGKAGVVNNISKFSNYDNVLKGDAFGDHLLSNKITTLTGGLQLKVKDEYERNQFQLTDNNGHAAGTALVHMGYKDLFIRPQGSHFLNQEYILTMKSKETGDLIKLAKFTPFNLF